MIRLTVGKKIGLGYATVIGILCIAAAFGIVSMRRASQAMSQVAGAYLPEMQLTSAFEREILNARIYFIYHVTIQKPGALDSGWTRYRNARALMPKLQNQVQANSALDAMGPLTTKLASDLDSYDVLLRQILAAVEKKENRGDGFTQLLTNWARMGGQLVDSAGELNRLSTAAVGSEATNHSSSLGSASVLSIAGCLLATIAAVVIAGMLTRSLARRLRRDIEELRGATDQLLTASHGSASASQSLAEGATRQAASIEEASASCEEINSMARQSAEHARAMAVEMAASQSASDSGSAVLQQMVGAMEEIRTSNDKVSRIIRVIDEIAFQTNILALNAAVEAARAGEAGMGFAVVADEVRNLAQRSAQAARDTTEMIGQSVTTVQSGCSYVEKVVGTMQAIASHSVRAKSMADQLNTASTEQTKGIAEIATAILALETVTTRMAASAEEGAAMAAELSERTDRMKGVADDLSSVVG